MANYKVDINNPLTQDEVRTAIEILDTPRDKFLLAFMYLSGARPGELGHHLRRGDFVLTEGDTHFKVRVYTEKLKHAKGFVEPYRTLEIALNAPFVQDYVLPYVHQYDGDDGMLLVDIGPKRIWYIVDRVLKGRACPTSFRHTRMWKLAQQDATVDQLKSWKGSRTIASITPYISNKPIGKKLVLD